MKWLWPLPSKGCAASWRPDAPPQANQDKVTHAFMPGTTSPGDGADWGSPCLREGHGNQGAAVCTFARLQAGRQAWRRNLTLEEREVMGQFSAFIMEIAKQKQK